MRILAQTANPTFGRGTQFVSFRYEITSPYQSTIEIKQKIFISIRLFCDLYSIATTGECFWHGAFKWTRMLLYVTGVRLKMLYTVEFFATSPAHDVYRIILYHHSLQHFVTRSFFSSWYVTHKHPHLALGYENLHVFLHELSFYLSL